MFGDRGFIKSIRMEYPTAIPTTVNILPAMWIHHGRETQELVKAYPHFFPEGYSVDYSNPSTVAHGTYRAGEHVDEWGCVWSNVDEGMEAIVVGHPVNKPEDIYTLEILQNRDERLPHGFMYLRLLDLCGFENAMMMFAEDNKRRAELRDPH